MYKKYIFELGRKT